VLDGRALVAVLIGGAIGAGMRYIIGTAFVQRFGPGVPYGTFAINIIGCLLIGIIAEFAKTRAFGITPTVRIFAATGVIGGFTTFSAFAYESVTLIGEGEALISALYVGASVFIGVLAVYLGAAIARIFTA
jgi:CrcB protein